MTELLSIILPVHNGEEYIEQCLTSILRQEYQSFELLIVDDGSDDDTYSICEKYADQDKRIKLYHIHKSGVVSARKKAADNACGEYTCFVDADDIVDSHYLSVYANIINKYRPEVIATGFIKDHKGIHERQLNKITAGVYEQDALKKIFSVMFHWSGLFEFGINPYLWTKCVKTELIRQIMEDTDSRIREGEDAAIVFPCILKSKKIVVSDECHYHYISRDDSVTHTRSFDYFENCAILYQDIKKKFENTDYYDIMRPQLDWYMRMLIYIENPNAFEMRTHIFPFGKIEKDSGIVLYGAGNVGNLYEYQVKSQEYARVVLWVDGSWERYSGDGRYIKSPECINNTEFDYVVIAIDNLEIAKHIRTYLLELGVADTKIVV